MPPERGAELAAWLARVALVLGAAAWVFRSRGRLLWTAGMLVYLAHVIGAFQFVYGWSHANAWRETARQTLALFGAPSGYGLYLNYLFTLVWIFDVSWWWRRGESARWYAGRRVALGFMAFMALNASAVVWTIRAIRPW